MLSKIQIGIAPNQKACIKVSEKKSDDVRDELVTTFRQNLHHTSNTLSLHFEGGFDTEQNYLILPVEDEIKYFDGLIHMKYLNGVNHRDELLSLAKGITDYFEKTKGELQ